MMEKSRLHKPARLLLILLNIILTIYSFVLIIFGVSEKVSGVGYGALYGDLLLSPPNIILAMGFLTIIISIYGLCGVDNYCQLVTYALFVLLLGGLDLVLGVSAGVIENYARDFIADGMMTSLQRTVKGFEIDDQNMLMDWSKTQREMKCCGVHGHEDWGMERGITTTTKAIALVGVPGSCFLRGEGYITEEDLNDSGFVKEHVFSGGCLLKLVEQLGYGRLQRIGVILATVKVIAGLAAGVVVHVHRRSWNKEFV